MALWSDSPRKASFLNCDSATPRIPRRSPASFYSNRDYASWPNKVFLCFVRDRLIWLHGMDESDPMIEKLLDIIHRSNPEENSSSL